MQNRAAGCRVQKSAHANDAVRLPRDRCYSGDGDAACVAGHHCFWPHYLRKRMLIHSHASCTADFLAHVTAL